jgi:MFS family permease
MTATAAALPDGIDDRLARRNTLVLAAAQALAGGNASVIFATGGIVGAMLAPDKSWATLPVTAYVIGLAMGTLPFGLMARRFGRRFAFLVGAGCGILTGLISALGVLWASFGLLCLGTFFGGLYAAGHQAYRFAAADTASEAFKPKAISWVLAGGLFAAFIGPQLVIHTKDLWQPFLFAATFIGQAAIAALAMIVLLFTRFPAVNRAVAKAGRPLGMVARQPRFVVAVVCGVASYALMNLVMTSAPLAMVGCNHSITDATLGLQWHVFAMYAPSFFTGSLIKRFGVERIIGVGLGLIALSAVVALHGLSLAHFWISLILLGVGWNFGFVGATTMVTQCHRPEERNQVQSLNDFLIFGTMAVGSLLSGKLLAWYGWAMVNQVVFPFIALAGALLIWLALRQTDAGPSPAK